MTVPQQYKSISAGFEWLDVPEFAVVTGVNGSGKTHLLQAMAASIEAAQAPPDAPGIRGVRHRLNRQPTGRVLYIPPYSAVGAVTLPPSGSPFDPRFANLVAEISRTFYDAHLRICEAKIQGEPAPPEKPWESVNAFLEAAEVPCRLTDPDRLKIGIRTGQFQAQVELLSRPGQFFQPSDLSPGEATILTLALWTLGANKPETPSIVIPRVVLLDEPDAHLHTSAIRRYLDVLTQQLVAQHGLRIIMTTHRPDTIALCPDESLFELHRSHLSPAGIQIPTRIEKTSINRVISHLSGHLFAASPVTRCVLVEDEDDVTFYSILYEACLPSKALPRLAFQPASTRRSAGEKVPGGKTVVERWVTKLRAADLSPLIQGIVDRDQGPEAEPGTGVHVLERYSIENYLLDPIVVYASLLHHKNAAMGEVIVGGHIRPGAEANLAELPDSDLQRISDAILAKVQPYLSEPATDDEKAMTEVEFTQGRRLTYPNWFMTRRGKNLVQSFRAAFGPSGSDTKPLLAALEWVGLVPNEIATIFRNVATAVSE